MADGKSRVDEATGTSTVGHEWDGIEELDTPMPRWWLLTLFATIAFAIVYTILYPAWPMVDRATAGVLHWSSHGQLADEMARDRAAKAGTLAQIAATPVEDIPANPALEQAAEEGGRSAFKVSCVQCHGSGATGSKGFPNLNDDDWLWGGDLKTIHTTLVHGVRYPGDDQTRQSQMPSFGADGILTSAQIDDVASFVRVISHQDAPSADSLRGAKVFADNCTACHGPSGHGNRQFGAPNLTDSIWLYGGDKETIVETLTKGRGGVMPAWGQRLDPVTVKMLAVYIHSLGGGEANPVPAPAPAQTATVAPAAAPKP